MSSSLITMTSPSRQDGRAGSSSTGPGAASGAEEDAMHPMFVQLFLEAGADDPPAEEEERRRGRRARRRRPATVARAAARARSGGPRPAYPAV